MQKRRDLFQYIRKKNYNIACLQDVHIDNKMHSYVKAEWGYNIVLSSKEGTNASRGVMILIKGMDSEPHKTPYVYVKYHHKFIPGTRECISGLLRKIFVFKVGKPSFFPASE